MVAVLQQSVTDPAGIPATGTPVCRYCMHDGVVWMELFSSLHWIRSRCYFRIGTLGTPLGYAPSTANVQLSLFGASLSETHLVRCMAEVSVATYVCTPYVHPIDFDVPAPYNFVRNGVSTFQCSLASYIDRSKNKRRGRDKEERRPPRPRLRRLFYGRSGLPD